MTIALVARLPVNRPMLDFGALVERVVAIIVGARSHERRPEIRQMPSGVSRHIKPWAECDTDAERLDVFNGLLLAPHLDALFDQGFVTVGDGGGVQVADELDADARRVLGLATPVRIRTLADGHRRYLAWHRERLFIPRGRP